MSISADWIAGGYGPPEIRETLARLCILCDGWSATRANDLRAGSVRDDVFVSSYPMALWLASSWWRLRWEPEPTNSPGIEWRMSHELPAAGQGYVWPPLTIAYDGEGVEVRARRSSSSEAQPIEYLSDRTSAVPAGEFEAAVDQFIRLVLDRLDARRVWETPLETLWADVVAERQDPAAADYRRLEAQVGFDPDEACTEMIVGLIALGREIGATAVSEIAPAFSGTDDADLVANLRSAVATEGIPVQLAGPLPAAAGPIEAERPWDQGSRLARELRAAWSLGTEPISNEWLSECLSVPASYLQAAPTPARLRLGLTVREDSDGRLFRLLLHKRNATGRRFEAARLLMEMFAGPRADAWLPATDSATNRQRAQRAFAAEFLCPRDALLALLDGDASDDALTEAAEWFQVSPLAVRSHLAFEGTLPRFDRQTSCL